MTLKAKTRITFGFDTEVERHESREKLMQIICSSHMNAAHL